MASCAQLALSQAERAAREHMPSPNATGHVWPCQHPPGQPDRSIARGEASSTPFESPCEAVDTAQRKTLRAGPSASPQSDRVQPSKLAHDESSRTDQYQERQFPQDRPGLAIRHLGHCSPNSHSLAQRTRCFSLKLCFSLFWSATNNETRRGLTRRPVFARLLQHLAPGSHAAVSPQSGLPLCYSFPRRFCSAQRRRPRENPPFTCPDGLPNCQDLAIRQDLDGEPTTSVRLLSPIKDDDHGGN